jgi:prevent-host-death family protein
MKPKRKSRVSTPDRVPLAQIKVNFSRYVRDVQTRGRPITITQHGRDAAVLAPVPMRPRILVRGPLDPRPLGAIELTPLPGRGASVEAIRRDLDEEREE